MALCNCDSGLHRHELRDAYGIFCTFVCDACEDRKREQFDPAIFAGPYQADEPIEAED